MERGRTILVTGSNRGIGRALVENYVSRGHTVFGCSRGGSDLDHEGYRHFVADVTDETSVRALLSDIAVLSGRIDILINNAGIKTSSLALLTTRAQAEAMITTNFLGAFLVTRETIKVMKRNRFGRIVNVSSIAVPLGSLGSAIYGASKAALEQLSYTLAREVAADDITINTIGVSVYLNSGMIEEIDPALLREAQKELLKPSPLTVHEIAHAVDFFASEQARNITNQIVYFGGVR